MENDKIAEEMAKDFYRRLSNSMGNAFKRNEVCRCGRKTESRKKALKLVLKANYLFLVAIKRCLRIRRLKHLTKKKK